MGAVDRGRTKLLFIAPHFFCNSARFFLLEGTKTNPFNPDGETWKEKSKMKTKILTTATFLAATAIAFVKRTASHLTLFPQGDREQKRSLAQLEVVAVRILQYLWSSRRPDQRRQAPELCIITKCLLPLLLIVCTLVPSAWTKSLFVVTQWSNSVAVIDSSIDQVTTQIPVGTGPVRICMSPDRLKAYVSNGGAATVSVVDAATLTTTATILVGAKPQESAVTPDGGRLFVVHQSTSPVTVIDTATNLVIANIVIGGNTAKDILFTLDGRFAYIANYSEGTVNVIDAATYRVKTIPTAAGPRRLAISPAGDRVFVTNYLGNSMSVINTLTQKLIATIPVGFEPRGIATTPSGDTIYVTNVGDGTVSIINSATLTVIKTITVGTIPWQVTITNDGTRAFVSNAGSGTVSVIDTTTRQVIKTLITGAGPFFSVTDPQHNKLYVSDSRDTTVAVIDIPSLTVLLQIPNVGSSPFDLAFGP